MSDSSIKKYRVIEDGSVITEDNLDICEDFTGLFDVTKSGKKPNFVGFIIKKNEIIVSFPKKYGVLDSSILDVKLLAKLMFKSVSKNIYDSNVEGAQNNFPIIAYLNVCEYYIQNGLYIKKIKEYFYGYNGRINWDRTIRSSSNIIVDDTLILFPFVVEGKNSVEVLITECMKEVLSLGFERFGSIFEVGVPFAWVISKHAHR
ncbi:LlaJI family restriction endonuclease [Erysipelothrix sp. D19-032]